MTGAPSLAVAPLDAEQAKASQEMWADHLDLPVEKKNDLPGGAKMTFILIPPGEFLMGSSDTQLKRLQREPESDDQRVIDVIRSEDRSIESGSRDPSTWESTTSRSLNGRRQ